MADPISQFNGPLILWELNDFKKATQPQVLETCLKVLRENPQWVNENPSPTKACFKLLKKTVLSSEEEKTRNQLFLKYSHLCRNISVTIGEITRVLPKPLLTSLSEKFRCMLKKDTLESETGAISLESHGCSNEEINSFLNFLEGKTVVSQDNVLSLVKFADEHFIKDLRKSCVDFFRDSLAVDTLIEFSQYAIDYNILELQWEILIYMSQKHSYNAFLLELNLELLKDQKISQEVKDLLRLGLKCPELGINPIWYKHEIPGIEVSFFTKKTTELKKKFSKLILKLNKIISASHLQIVDPHLDGPNLNEIISFIPNFKSLFIFNRSETNNKLFHISLKNNPKCKFLFVSKCNTLKSIDAPHVTKLTLNYCDELQNIHIPQANKFAHHGSNKPCVVTMSKDCKIKNVPQNCELQYV